MDSDFYHFAKKKNSQENVGFSERSETYLWQKGKTYPNDLHNTLDRLYKSGEVSITMGYQWGKSGKN